MDMLRQSRYFMKLRTTLLRHPEVKLLICRIRLLHHRIHSKESTYTQAKRAVSLLDRVKMFSNSPNQENQQLAKAAVMKAQQNLSMVHQKLRRLLKRLVRNHLLSDPDFHPVYLVDSLCGPSSDPTQQTNSNLPQIQNEELRRLIELRHGPTPSSNQLVDALYHTFSDPTFRPTPEMCAPTPIQNNQQISR